MRESRYAVSAALALSLLCAAPAAAAAGPVRLPAEVTAGECIRGGGLIIISVDGSGTGSFTKRCQGGTHDGETVT
ncbi:hypothetical protein [Streptomyces sp. BK79]|uniref:hypothetical protein n=1 Tax=Streptomyces sp. BK79 TaxID=3350097 RepID=UPI0037705905